jgi:hypothetical protein
MRKIIIMIVVGLICIVIGVLVVGYLPRLKPSVLCTHVSGAQWRRVFVQSTNFHEKKVFQPKDTLTLSPIAHGVYTVSVEYANGETIWTQFFHFDAGVRRKIDLFFEGNPKTSPVKIREIANGNVVLFEDQATPNETSAERPLRLDWI